MCNPIKEQGLLKAINGRFLNKLLGEQIPKAVICQSHKPRFLAHKFILAKMPLHYPQRAKIFPTSLNKAVTFIVSHTINIMRPCIQECLGRNELDTFLRKKAKRWTVKKEQEDFIR